MARNKRKTNPGVRDSKHADVTVPLPKLDETELYDLVRSGRFRFVLILDGIEDPHNLGACMRTADATGVDAVVAPRKKAAPLTDTARRVAAGGAEHVPFVQVTNLARAMENLKDAGLLLVGTADAAHSNLYEVDLSGPVGIVMGSEGKGMRRLTTENCDELVRIPMGGHVDCLNISVAAGVAMFEVVRQRLNRASR